MKDPEYDCPTCEGIGTIVDDNGDVIDCPTCGGTGEWG